MGFYDRATSLGCASVTSDPRRSSAMKHLSGMMLAMLAGLTTTTDAAEPVNEFPLQGTWTLMAADKNLPGGEQDRDYGEEPKGRLIVNQQGRYPQQIGKT